MAIHKALVRRARCILAEVEERDEKMGAEMDKENRRQQDEYKVPQEQGKDFFIVGCFTETVLDLTPTMFPRTTLASCKSLEHGTYRTKRTL